MAICTPAVPGAAEAVKQSGRTDVKVIGLGLPNDNKPYVHEGITDCRDPLEHRRPRLPGRPAPPRPSSTGTLKPGDPTFDAGRLGTVEIEGDNILLGKPFRSPRRTSTVRFLNGVDGNNLCLRYGFGGCHALGTL